MSMERVRRDRFATQAIPSPWEIPAALTLAFLFLLAVTPLIVQGIVTWLMTGTFSWPDNPGAALDGLARGRFGDGLPPSAVSQLPSDAVMWALTAATEIVVLGTLIALAFRLRHLRAGASHGLASRAQATDALGAARLRASAGVIRPDLHGRHTLPRRRRWGRAR